MRRREFITLLASAGATASWTLCARAQQPDQTRRIGVFMNRAADDSDGQLRLAAFQHGLQEFGWIDGRNVRIDTRWGEDNVDRERRYAEELVALAPNVIVASGTLSVAALQRVACTLQIVFVLVIDPVGAGFVDSLARPGRNVTGFMNHEYSLSAKFLELLKHVAPSVTRAAFRRGIR
jgi:ABC-type uncharacterized transport system substrate-binding protein